VTPGENEEGDMAMAEKLQQEDMFEEQSAETNNNEPEDQQNGFHDSKDEEGSLSNDEDLEDEVADLLDGDDQDCEEQPDDENIEDAEEGEDEDDENNGMNVNEEDAQAEQPDMYCDDDEWVSICKHMSTPFIIASKKSKWVSEFERRGFCDLGHAQTVKIKASSCVKRHASPFKIRKSENTIINGHCLLVVHLIALNWE